MNENNMRNDNNIRNSKLVQIEYNDAIMMSRRNNITNGIRHDSLLFINRMLVVTYLNHKLE